MSKRRGFAADQGITSVNGEDAANALGGTRVRASLLVLAALMAGALTTAWAGDIEREREESASPNPADASDGSARNPSGAGAATSSNELGTVAVKLPTDDPAASPQRSDSRLIEEIVITAQKREENLQDVPISIQAFSAGALDARGVTSLSQLQQITPGMQYNTQVGYTQIYIRGVGTDSIINSADPTVATYTDGVYFPFAQNVTSSLGAIERVEVLKGPQGTLFGRNSTGGAINVVMKQPGPDFASSLSASYERFDTTKIQGYVNIPLWDPLAVSVSGVYYCGDSYYRPAPESDSNGVPQDCTKGFAVKTKWAPLDGFYVQPGYTYTKISSGTAGLTPLTDPRPLGRLFGMTPTAPSYETRNDLTKPNIGAMRVTTLHAGLESDTIDSRLILADQKIVSRVPIDFDGTQYPYVTADTVGQFFNVKTAELQLLSKPDSWGADWMSWIGGLYYLDSSVGYDPVVLSLGGGVVRFLTEPGALGQIPTLTEPLIDVVSGLPLAGQLVQYVDNGMQVAVTGILDTKSTAGFFQLTFKPADWWDVVLGGRLQQETRELVKANTSFRAMPGETGGDVAIFTFPQQRKERHNFSPRVVIDFHLANDALLYLSYSVGFKSGTYNTLSLTTPSKYVRPERVDSYELGYKDTLLDGNLTLNTALFQSRVKNLQGQIISLISGGLASIVSQGEARIRGAEFDAVWEPMPSVIRGFVVTASGSYLDGRYTSFPDGAGYDEETGLYFDGTIFPTRDFTGNRTVRTPKITGALTLSQTFDLQSGQVEAAVDGYYNSGFYFTAQNLPVSEQKSYALLGARASYLHAPWNLRLTIFGTNLTGTKYAIYSADTDFGTIKLLAPPEVYGLRLNWSF
ncbi:MAG TPA: TonB-dependent receptor [Vicinamibacterales bacterium]|nr:TonB-dependent receptor [Vicinamibacterales bacterium]